VTAAHRGEPPPHPLHRRDEDPPPPLREQLPLPRRSQQDHLEPQLREPGGSGEGTPFVPFGSEPAPIPDATGDKAAAFHDGAACARAGTEPSEGS
jgi:hypothetical protein